VSLKKLFIINAASSWAAMIVSIFSNLIVIPIMLSKLGVDKFGVWSLLSYGLAYPAILQSALCLAINRYVAYYNNDPKQLNFCVSASFVTFLILSMMTVIASIIVSFYLTNMFSSIPLSLAKDAQTGCILVGMTLAVTMLGASFSGALMGRQAYTVSNGITIIGDTLRGVFTIVFLLFWNSIATVQFAFLLSSSISAFLMYFAAKKAIPFLKVSLINLSKRNLIELFSFTLHSIARSGSTIFIQNTLLLLVGWKGTSSDVTVFTIAFRLPTFLRGFISSAQNVFLPAVATLCAENKLDEIKSIAKRGTLLCGILTFIPSILLFFFTGEVLQFWLGNNFPNETVNVMRVVMISTTPAFFEIWLPVLVGMGHVRALTVTSLLTVLGVIGITMLAFEYTTVPMAPAIALAITYVVRTAVWMPIYGSAKISIPSLEYFKTSVFPLFLSVCITSIVIISFKRWDFVQNFHWIISLTICAMFTTIIFGLFSAREEMRYIFTLFKKKLSLIGVSR